MIDYEKKVNSYIRSVYTHRRICGKWEKAAVTRHLEDLKKVGSKYPYFFDVKKAMLILNFSKMLNHYKGPKAGKMIELEGWECFILWCVFGWQKKDGSGRRFTYADVEVARKNGKTTLAAIIALYMALLDGEQAGEVYIAAMDKDQAKICWEAAMFIAKGSPAIAEMFEYYTSKSSIVQPDSLSTIKPFSKDTKNKDGLNPSCGICDERHAWKTNELLDVLKSGMGARRQPLIFSITTAGTDMSLPYYRDLKILKEILSHTIIQDNQFVMLFELDEGDDWRNEKVWKKANPNLNVSISIEYMRGEFLDAINKQSTYETNFKTKNLNMYVDAPSVWIADDKIILCDFDTNIENLSHQECYAGLDLASHVDVNALELYFPNIENHPVLSFFWIPENKMKENTDRVDYRQWVQDGWMTATPGDVIDIDWILSDIDNILKKYDVRNISYDPAKAYHGVIQGLIKLGYESILDEFSQSMMNMSEPTKEMQRLILEKNVDLMKNPVLRWMFQNIAIYTDPNANIKMDKKKSSNKIDGVVALANAIGGYMSSIADTESKIIYKGHGLRTLKI